MTLRSFRFRSIFITIANSLIIVCISICIIFSIIIGQTIVHSDKEALMQNNQAHLDLIINNTDYLLQTLCQSQAQMTYSGDILNLIYSHTLSEKDISSTHLELIHLAEQTLLIKEAFLYIQNSDLVISSYKTELYYRLDSFRNNHLIMDYHNKAIPISTLNYNGKKYYLFFNDSQLVLVHDFPLTGEKRLASLFYVIQLSELNEFLYKEIPSSTSLMILDENKNIINLVHNNVQDISPSFAPETLWEDGIYNTDQGAVHFSKASAFTNWHYIYSVDDALLHTSTAHVLQKLLPSLLLILPVSIIVSFLIAQFIYRPIQALLNTIEKSNPLVSGTLTDKLPKNEIEYFEYAYQNTTEKKQELNQLLNVVSYDTTSRLLHDLMANTLSEKDKVSLPELLTAINSPFREDSLYLVCLIEFSETKDDIEKLKIQFLKDLKDIGYDFNLHNSIHSHTLMMHGLIYCVIFCFPKNSRIITVQKTKQSYKEEITKYGKRLGITFTLAYGHLYHSIYDLPYSLHDASAHIEKKKEDELNEATPDTCILDTELIPDYNTYAQHIIDLIVSDDISEAHSLSRRIVSQIEESPADFSAKAETYITFLNLLVSLISKLDHIDNLPYTSEDFTSMILSKQGDGTAHTLSITALKMCDDLIEETNTLLKKQKNHYLLSAKEYISKNYQDFNLSLNSVSAAIDINPSYLSRLFKNNLGIRFTEYLNTYRINRSIELLKQTKESVQSISEKTGFSSVQNYIRVFKKFTGYTPKQFRDESAKNL